MYVAVCAERHKEGPSSSVPSSIHVPSYGGDMPQVRGHGSQLL